MENELFNYYKNALSGSLGEPLCAEYKNEWRAVKDNKEELVKLVMRQQSIPHFATFCHNKLGLTKKYILSEFGNYINGYTIHDADGVDGYTYGIYVDWDYDTDLDVDKDVIHVMWTVGATLFIPKTKCPTIYISNKSKVHLVCEGFNSVRVYMFDKSELTIEDCDNDCSVTVLKYSDKCKVERGKFCLSEKIKEFNKELKL